jgi:hypothetical protein
MSTTELVEQIRQLSTPERLQVVEAVLCLIRQDLQDRNTDARADQDRRMQAAALALKDLYEPGGELTEWNCLDAEEVLDDYVPR